jgi:hypothetical protein
MGKRRRHASFGYSQIMHRYYSPNFTIHSDLYVNRV